MQQTQMLDNIKKKSQHLKFRFVVRIWVRFPRRWWDRDGRMLLENLIAFPILHNQNGEYMKKNELQIYFDFTIKSST